jgi:class 3 adenylate cyclase
VTSNKESIFDRDFALTSLMYGITIVILIFYCLNACTFRVAPKPFAFPFVVIFSFALALLLRTLAIKFIRKLEPSLEGRLRIKNPWHYLFIDLASWIFAGLLVILLSVIFFKTTLESNTEIFFGCFALGVFYSRFLSLRIEKEMIISLSKIQNFMNFPTQRFFSLSTKFFMFIMVYLTLISIVAILLFYKDFNLSETSPFFHQYFGLKNPLNQFLFVIIILYFGAFVVAYQYKDNFRVVMNYQLKAFEAVENGNYRVLVPVATEDEFSLIAMKTNQMILGLRERDKIKTAFGKYMSPTVANSILATEGGTSLEGRLVNVVIMFIDIRNYTVLAEKKTPQEVVSLLNAYFSLIVQCVHKHQGVVDKFIGDAAMTVFGLDEKEPPEKPALKAAFEVIRLLPELNASLQARNLPAISIGIGIHSGPAIAGNIGSEERLEFTVIGDAVNTASRLESLNKELKTTITISEAIYNAIPEEFQAHFTFKGSYPLKGKSAATSVYSQ